jgi:DNA polymerase-3 subunit alpha/error-prone DNA polymerase
MVPLKELLEKFSDSKIIENTECIIAECNFEFEFKTPKNKTYYTDSGENDMQLLTRLNKEGLLRIYGNTNVLARARVEKELLSMS